MQCKKIHVVRVSNKNDDSVKALYPTLVHVIVRIVYCAIHIEIITCHINVNFYFMCREYTCWFIGRNCPRSAVVREYPKNASTTHTLKHDVLLRVIFDLMCIVTSMSTETSNLVKRMYAATPSVGFGGFGR